MHPLINKVRELAEENPSAIYEGDQDGCFYTIGEAGQGSGCIIGQALLKLDPSLETNLIAMDVNPVGAKTLLEDYLHMNLTTADIDWLVRVQTHQDEAKPWEDSVSIADAEIANA